jgi:polar amino acid transport system substrate-binding protein
VRAEFVQNDWQTLVPSLERDDFDVALNGIEVTPARRARVAFTRPYYAFTETLVVPRADGRVRALADLRGARVGTLEGSLAADLVRAEPGVEIVLYEGVEEPYLDLERGRLAGVLLDNIIAARYGLPRARCAPPRRWGRDLRDRVATRPAGAPPRGGRRSPGMTADGELRRILERWRLWDERQPALGGRARSPRRGPVARRSPSGTCCSSSAARRSPW